jgi:UDP-N-acetylglucosamine--N-acetylmuramyl-(pentapeptide) pyrophosphoryl-undecaprenol N-acetylglucosamine transferase
MPRGLARGAARSTNAMRVVITGGGTGGHTSAGLAVASALRARGVADLHWIGSRGGVDARRVPEAGIAFHPVPAGKLRRYLDWQNLSDVTFRVPAGLVQSWRLLRRLRPSLVFATGGFVSLAPALAARALQIPVIVHEQTSVPGLANRIAGRFAQRIAVTFPPREGDFAAERVVLTGNPLRPELLGGSRESACRRFSLDPRAPIVYVTGGSLGSHKINRTVGEILPELLEVTQVIHQAGDNPDTGDLGWLTGRRRALPPALEARYALVAHVGAELRDVYSAADLVVGRSGAGTVNECCHLGRPAIYVPLPGTSGDEQTVNARTVAAAGGAVVLVQDTLTAAGLLGALETLLDDRPALEAMAERARNLAVPDAADRIARLIFDAAGASIAASRPEGGGGSARQPAPSPTTGAGRE